MKVRMTRILVAAVVVTMAVTSMASAANLVQNGNFLNWTRASNQAYQKGDFWTVYNTIGIIAPSQGSSFGSGTELIPLPDGSTGWDKGELDGDTSVQVQQCQRIKLDSAMERGGLYQQVAVTPGEEYTLTGWMFSHLTQSSQVEARIGIVDGAFSAPNFDTVWSDPAIGISGWTQALAFDWDTGEYMPMKIIPTSNFVTIFLDGNHPTNDTPQCNVFFDDISLSDGTAVPEPGSMIAVLSGLVGLIGLKRRTK